MYEINPHIGFDKENCNLRLFDFPFDDFFFDKKNGLYCVGDGFAAIYLQFSQKLPHVDEVDSERLVNRYPFMLEFEIYATPDSLNMPVLKKYKGVLQQNGLVDLRLRWLNETAEYYGAGFFESLFFKKKLRKYTNELIDLNVNIESLGNRLIDEYSSMKLRDDKLSEIVANFKKEKGGEVIPLFAKL